MTPETDPLTAVIAFYQERQREACFAFERQLYGSFVVALEQVAAALLADRARIEGEREEARQERDETLQMLDDVRSARDAFKEDANALRRNYLRETKDLAQRADAAESARAEAERERDFALISRDGSNLTVQLLRAQLATAHAVQAGLREALERAAEAIHGEYCGRTCHVECSAVRAALAASPDPD